ncbi:MAG: DNA repair protein RecN [Candidatus Margulisiibacteriota bacterium]
MLQHLEIKNFALIENLEIDLSDGYNVFTGETGAGKTIILNALNLVLGERASADLLRPGADKLEVTAVFALSPLNPPKGGLKMPFSEIILKREISSSGKSLAKINGEIVPLTELKKLGDTLVDLHGQHEHQSLLNTERHIDFLDSYAALNVDVELVSVKYQELSRLQNKYAQMQNTKNELESKLDFLRFQLAEIEELRLQEGEDEELEQEKQILNHAEQLHQHAGNSKSALEEVDISLRRVELAEIASIDSSIRDNLETYNNLLYSIEELNRDIGTYLDKIEFNPARLLEIDERLSAINHLKRKYGPSISGLLAKQTQLASEIETVELGEENLKNLESEIKQKKADYLDLAEKLSVRRKAAAAKLEQSIIKHLGDLSMDKTIFQTAFQQCAPSSMGIDQAEFLISPNPGQPLRPLVKIASGGEISRVMLALKSALLEADPVETMIFDEIDVGIGGKTATSVGKKMCDLSLKRQVICITHLPQIASRAEKHFVVEKLIVESRTEVTVREVQGQSRHQEIARMLSGDVTETTLKHAEELLSS